MEEDGRLLQGVRTSFDHPVGHEVSGDLYGRGKVSCRQEDPGVRRMVAAVRIHGPYCLDRDEGARHWCKIWAGRAWVLWVSLELCRTSAVLLLFVRN